MAVRGSSFFLGAFSAMADAGVKMVTMFGVKCPMGDQCKKGSAWLGNKSNAWFSDVRARQAIYDHLVGSPFHKDIDPDLATEYADAAEVQSWEVPEEEEDAEENTAGPSAKDKRKWEDEETWYWDPNQRAKHQKLAKPKPKAQPSSAVAVRSEAASSSAVARVSTDLGSQIRTQTRNAYVFVKAMTKAEAALQTASRLSRSAYQTFQDLLET